MASTSVAYASGILHKKSPRGRIKKAGTRALIYISLFLFTCLAPLRTQAQQQEAYLESNGLVVIQAESLTPMGDWVQESSDAGFTGPGYIRWNGPNLYGSPGVGIMAYTVYISEPGDYNVRLRMSHLGAPAGDQWNDCWAKMDNGAWAKALHPADKMQNGFTFDSILEPDFGVFESMRYTLSEGVHTLYLSGRSENLRIDRIHFYKDSVPDPLNLSLPESPLGVVDGSDDGGDDGSDDGSDDGGDDGSDDGGDDGTPTDTVAVSLAGELMKWHPVTLTMDGPEAAEAGTPSPFLDYRFQVTFTQDTLEYTVPGYFAADGNAAETGAREGNKWRAHFVPPTTGVWTYTIAMREGQNVAVETFAEAGVSSVGDGATGSFIVGETDKTGRDHRGKGMLRYVNDHYLQFDNGDYFLKGGANSPENFLAYADFDSTYNNAGADYVKRYEPHVIDWNDGDPTWRNGLGKGIIGAVNYLSNEGMNAIYFITMNVDGDGNDVWPWTSPTTFTEYDVSKLAQWDRVFQHMDAKGIMLHVLLQETENELLLNNGELGLERKLYYRELVARFGYHHALTWNLGEENDDNTDAQRKAFASYIRTLDPYNHPIVVHTYPGEQDDIYTPLLGFEDFEGVSLQMNDIRDIHDETLLWRELSAESGRPWIVSLDEIGPYQIGVTEDGSDNNHDEVRHQALWANLMAGGAGVEWYFGYDTGNNDLTAEDWRTRGAMWKFTRYALDFFQTHLPFTTMEPLDELTPDETDFVFGVPDSLYAIYMPEADTLQAYVSPGVYALTWYNPRTGGALLEPIEITLNGNDLHKLGAPPAGLGLDWVALLTQLEAFEDESHPLEVTAFTLIDADSDTVLSTLEDGATLDLGILPRHLNIAAVTRTDPGQQVTYVYLELDPTDSRRKEVVPPYALFGDLGGNYLPGTFDQGALTLTATPYGLDGNPDQPGKALSISFTVKGYNPNTQASKHIGESVEDEGIETAPDDLPATFTLEANYPNPFNPTTTIPFTLEESSRVHLAVYDLTGRLVQSLIDREVQAGRHEVVFEAVDLPSGTYMYRLTVGGTPLARQMILLK